MFFRPEIAVANHGESGESLRGFVGERRLAKLISAIKPGDWLVIQMGHNDQKERGEGVGAFTTYKQSLKEFIRQAREHGATPVLITPMNRLTFDTEGRITNSLGDYPEAVRQEGKEENVPVIDLNAMSKPFYEALGPVEARKAFADADTTHHSNYGSYELAKVRGGGDSRTETAACEVSCRRTAALRSGASRSRGELRDSSRAAGRRAAPPTGNNATRLCQLDQHGGHRKRR